MSQLKFLFSRKPDGNMDFRFGGNAEVRCNRETFLGKYGVHPGQYVMASAQHGDEIVTVSRLTHPWSGAYGLASAPKCDAMVTTDPNFHLALGVADCPTIAIHDHIRNVLGFCHAGHKGLSLGLIPKVVTYMRDNHGCDPSTLTAKVGPFIGDWHAQYNSLDFIKDHKAVWEKFYNFNKTTGVYHFDFGGLLKNQLLESGIARNNITMPLKDMETYSGCDRNFFSHRRWWVDQQRPEDERHGEVQGRFIVTAGMLPN